MLRRAADASTVEIGQYGFAAIQIDNLKRKRDKLNYTESLKNKKLHSKAIIKKEAEI